MNFGWDEKSIDVHMLLFDAIFHSNFDLFFAFHNEMFLFEIRTKF